MFRKQKTLTTRLSALATKLALTLQTIPPVLTLSIAALLAIAFFTLRDHGVYATVMWDEWEYNGFGRQLPIVSTDIPYYLYYLTYSITRLCGEGFLSCAQFMNAVFLAASMPFIYLVGRRTTSQNLSLFVAIASIFGGISVYVTHFVPEAMYFFGFWLGVWAFLKAIDAKLDVIRIALGAGSAVAVLSLVKLHAQFLMPGLVLYFIFCGACRLIEGGMRKGLLAAFLAVVAFAIVRLSLGYVFATTAGFNIFGTAYTSNVGSAVASHHALIDLLAAALPLLLCHILVIATLYAVPMLILATTVSNIKDHTTDAKTLSLQALAVCLLLPLLIVVACYSAQVRAIHPEIEGSEFIRLHLRYYNFLFPLFVLIAASTWTLPEPEHESRSVKFILAALAITLIIAFAFALRHFQLSVFDGPELRGFATIAIIKYFLLACAFLSVAVWVWNGKHGALFFLAIFFPLIVLMSTAAAFYSARLEKTPNIAHQAGLFAKAELGKDASKLAIISPDYAGAYQAMFMIDNPNIDFKFLVPNDTCLTLTPAPNGKEWFLLLGNYQLKTTADRTVAKDGYRLVHVAPPSAIETQPCAVLP